MITVSLGVSLSNCLKETQQKGSTFPEFDGGDKITPDSVHKSTDLMKSSVSKFQAGVARDFGTEQKHFYPTGKFSVI